MRNKGALCANTVCTRDNESSLSRTSIFSLVQGVVFLGLTPAYWLGGILSDKFHSLFLAYYLSALTSFLAFLYVATIVPESFVCYRLPESHDADLPSDARERSPALEHAHRSDPSFAVADHATLTGTGCHPAPTDQNTSSNAVLQSGRRLISFLFGLVFSPILFVFRQRNAETGRRNGRLSTLAIAVLIYSIATAYFGIAATIFNTLKFGARPAEVR